PENLIENLEVVSGAAYVHLIGEKQMFKTCYMEVDAGALCLEDIYGDITVKTITGAIKLNTPSILSNICLETMVGVVDISVNEISDDVSIQASGTIKRNAFYKKSTNLEPKYLLKVRNRLGVTNIH
ncbi:MAG: hypothetical protein ACK5LC_15655, partial [Coprobacillaceae bacterium]